MPKANATAEPEPNWLFDTPEYSYRVFVTNITVFLGCRGAPVLARMLPLRDLRPR
jgi:hypothetical protein